MPSQEIKADDQANRLRLAKDWTSDRIKDWINSNIYSDAYQVDKSLMHISGVQKALESKNIDYFMFFGYDLPLTKAEQYGIDLKRFVTLQSLYDNYFSSDWQKKFSTTNISYSR